MVGQDEKATQRNEVEIVHKQIDDLNPKKEGGVAVEFVEIGGKLKVEKNKVGVSVFGLNVYGI